MATSHSQVQASRSLTLGAGASSQAALNRVLIYLISPALVLESGAYCWKTNCLKFRIFIYIMISSFFILSPQRVLGNEDSGYGVRKLNNGRLSYETFADGARVPDFSAAGYHNGGSPIPEASIRIQIEAIPVAQEADATARIQDAIDRVGRMKPNRHGLRGTVQLREGTFRIAGTILFSKSGVVLRGAGIDRTVLEVVGQERPVLIVGSAGSFKRTDRRNRSITAPAAVGDRFLKLSDTSSLRPGDDVIVQRPASATWITAIGMDRIPDRRDGSTKQWRPGPGLLMDRQIQSISGDTVELDAGITSAVTPDDGASVWTYELPEQVTELGIEDLTAVGNAVVAKEGASAYPWNSVFVTFKAVKDAWLRGVRIRDFAGSIYLEKTARNITISQFGIDALPKTTHGGAAPTAVLIAGQKILVRDCIVRGQRLIAIATQSWAAGPNVVQYCHAEGTRVSIGAHQRWATAVLLDNVTVSDAIGFENRGNHGTGQGWTAAYSVVWNSICTRYIIESPPTATNWAFGLIGQPMRSTEYPGREISRGVRVKPESLYDAQLRDRSIGLEIRR